MKTFKSKLLCVVLSLVLVFSMFVATATTAFASTESTASDVEISYETNTDGTISGTVSKDEFTEGEFIENVNQRMNTLYTNSTDIYYTDADKDSIYSTEIRLVAQAEVASFQMELYVPGFLEITDVYNSEYLGSSETDLFYCDILSATCVKVTYSSGYSLPNGEYALFTINYRVIRPMNTVDYMNHGEIIFTDSEANEVPFNIDFAPIYIKYDSGEITPTTYSKGDVDMNGVVDLQDAIILQRSITYSNEELYGDAFNYGDIDNNGTLNIRDVQFIQMYLVGKLTLDELNNVGGGSGEVRIYNGGIFVYTLVNGTPVQIAGMGSSFEEGRSIRDIAINSASGYGTVLGIYYDSELTVEVAAEDVVSSDFSVYVLVEEPGVTGEYNIYDVKISEEGYVNLGQTVIGKASLTEESATVMIADTKFTAPYIIVSGMVIIDIGEFEQYMLMINGTNMYLFNYFNGNDLEVQQQFVAVAGEYTVIVDEGENSYTETVILYNNGAFRLYEGGMSFLGSYTYEGNMFALNVMGTSAYMEFDPETRTFTAIVEENGGNNGGGSSGGTVTSVQNIVEVDSASGEVVVVGKIEMSDGMAKFDFNGVSDYGAYTNMDGAIIVITENYKQYIFTPYDGGLMLYNHFDGSQYQERAELKEIMGEYVATLYNTVQVTVNLQPNGIYVLTRTDEMYNAIIIGDYSYENGIINLVDFDGNVASFEIVEGNELRMIGDTSGGSGNGGTDVPADTVVGAYTIYSDQTTDGTVAVLGKVTLYSSGTAEIETVDGTIQTAQYKLSSDGSALSIIIGDERTECVQYNGGYKIDKVWIGPY